MFIRTAHVTKLHERELETNPVAINKESMALVDDEGRLHFRVAVKQEEDDLLIETFTFNRYETQKIRAVLNRA